MQLTYMKFDIGNLYHVYNRGINRQKVFYRQSNYEFFLSKLTELQAYCDILAWCLMRNHFHLLIYLNEYLLEPIGDSKIENLPRKIGTILSSYAQAINRQETRTGSLFQAKTKAKELKGKWANYCSFVCFNYIHQNPVKSGLAFRLEDWEYSSFKDYLEGRPHSLVNIKRAVELLDIPTEKNAFYEQSCRAIQDQNLIHLKV